jgi:predicted ATPase
MLTRLYFKHFKCFEKLSLYLAPLTLLSGFNSAGKTTVMQVLGLLHQTAKDDNEGSNGLLLNGSVFSLGTAGDVMDEFSGSDELAIWVETEDYQCQWQMLSTEGAAHTIPVQSVTLTDYFTSQTKSYAMDSSMAWRRLLPKLSYEEFPQIANPCSEDLYKLTYLTAERMAPKEFYPVNGTTQPQTVGVHGEYTPWYLFNYADKLVSDALQLPGYPPQLQRQTEGYLDYFFPGTHFSVTPVDRALITLGVRTSQGGKYHRPQNVGYGLTQILPILTACLGANKGDIILIENPEAHLHPAAQAQMGSFLSKVAASGVQVILETHSDHILSGLRRAAKEKQLTPEQIAIYFFRPRPPKELKPKIAQVLAVLIDPEGNLEGWPTGFFDQFEKDSAYFAGWGDNGLFGE